MCAQCPAWQMKCFRVCCCYACCTHGTSQVLPLVRPHNSNIGSLQYSVHAPRSAEPRSADYALAPVPCASPLHQHVVAHTLRVHVQTSWLTPVELFRPWYGQAVAKYVVRHHLRMRTNAPLTLLEIGGGRGTLAKNILVRTTSSRHSVPQSSCRRPVLTHGMMRTRCTVAHGASTAGLSTRQAPASVRLVSLHGDREQPCVERGADRGAKGAPVLPSQDRRRMQQQDVGPAVSGVSVCAR